jgi:hypothetical protein
MRSAFENNVRSYASDIARCIDSNGTVSRQNLICRNIAPGDDLRGQSNDMMGIEVKATELLLVIGVELDRQRYMIFMPRRLMQLGRIRQFQFR